MRGAWLAAITFGMLAIAGTVGFALYGGLGGNAISLWTGVALSLAIVGGLFAFYRHASAQGQDAFYAALAAPFKASEAQWFFGTGLAIDRKAGRLLLADRGLCKIYDIAQVGRIDAHVHVTSAAGSSSNPISALINLFMLPTMLSEYFENGLYVEVADPAHPSWHLFGINAAAAAHWTELINSEKRSRTATA
jgi:hypothetical protein